MKRIMLFLVAMLAMVAIMALPAMAYHDGYEHYGQDNDESGYQDNDEYGNYDDDDYGDERYPPGYDDSHEPRPPDCDWYGPYGHGNDAWWEYWCYWHGWGWEFVFWAWA